MAALSSPLSFAKDDLTSLHDTIVHVGTARNFVSSELSRIPMDQRGPDMQKIADLISQTNRPPNNAKADASHFWASLADGILLCLLANHLRTGCVDSIDRRSTEWARSDNISRFLRAARDQLGLRSKDLFQTFDLTDGTFKGLLRVSYTLSIVAKSVKRSSSVAAVRTNPALLILPRTTSMTPPTTPRARNINELVAEPASSRSPHSVEQTIPTVDHSAVQRHRQEAERILSVKSEQLAADPPADLRNAQSRPAYTAKHKSSITFADSVKVGGDEENRTPYRDRKLSESAVSLTGVAEEEADDLVPSTDKPLSRRPLSMTAAPRLGQARRDSSDSDTSISLPAWKPSLARTTSQKRISQELALGQTPRAFFSSTDNLSEQSSSSPLQSAAARRNIHRAQPGPSLFNPSRESLLHLGSNISADSDSSPRVPFPRGALAIDSPGARRLGRHLSMNADMTDTSSLVSSSSVGNTTASPRPGARPNFRHARYSSDLHLPTLHRPNRASRSPDPSADDQSFASRTRFDSEAGSLYSNTYGSLTSEELGSVVTTRSGGRNPPAPKHKLVVTEDGKPDVTYQLGNCIGRGQFGSVYRALNLNSGRMVAVKRIKLHGRSDDDVTELMNEVDLLKSLSHPSVVKYEGLVRGPEVVSIILEYVENGSLLHTLKAFGNFPEKLVSSYVVKILEGLNYLHEQNVAHCDLKAANILTTKNGNVKLSDFGVSLNLKAVKEMGRKNDAIGTPNWMAPEVIELKGVTVKADIWSLACTIIELLTGKPPYYDMLAMSAMFRIVEDDCPPIPDKCSPHLNDLLVQCFNKDATKRPTAEMLFEHKWVQQVWTGNKELRELRPQDSVPFLRRINADMRRLDPRMFERAGAEPVLMERATSTPPATLQRPALDVLRSQTTPAESSPASASNSPAGRTLTLPDLHEATATSASSGEGMPVSPTSPTPFATTADPSLSDELKPHAFVKSSFSKAVMCKICREPVKKHAVLCEECGLMCHARCAVQAAPLCNVRAQLFMYQQHASLGQMSPPASLTGHDSVSPPLSHVPLPAVTPAGFKFPFGLRRESKSSSADPNSSVELANVSQESGAPLTPVSLPSAKVGKDSPPSRKRRISLLPGRHQTTPPAPEVTEIRLSTNNSSSPSILLSKEGRRHSSMSYGSLSGSSSISSGGGGNVIKTSSTGHSAPLHQQLGILSVTSTPVLPHGVMSYDEKVTQNRFRRRLSSGPALGQPKASQPQLSDNAALVNAKTPAIATAERKLERKKSRRVSSKADCLVM